MVVGGGSGGGGRGGSGGGGGDLMQLDFGGFDKGLAAAPAMAGLHYCPTLPAFEPRFELKLDGPQGKTRGQTKARQV